MIIGGGGLPEGCTKNGECRGCESIGALGIGCARDKSEFWVERRVKTLLFYITTFGHMAALRWLLKSCDASTALDLWEMVVEA